MSKEFQQLKQRAAVTFYYLMLQKYGETNFKFTSVMFLLGF